MGNTLEFLLSPTRDAEAAKRFFAKALRTSAGSTSQARPSKENMALPTASAATTTPSVPRVINTDKSVAYPKAIAELKAAGILPEHVELRQVKYLAARMSRRKEPSQEHITLRPRWSYARKTSLDPHLRGQSSSARSFPNGL